jgi:hypothetical protein
MPIIEVNGKDLLDVVKEMAPEEFEAFIEKALSVRPRARTTTLSAQETKLIQRINRGLPMEFSNRYNQLAQRRKKGTLTPEEHRELLKLTHEAESRDADRADALLALAKRRHLPVRTLMKQMGIRTPAIHG